MLCTLRRILKIAIDCGICVYLVLILGVMPFYNRRGYARIGTDKAHFFDTTITNMGKLLLPVAGIYLVIRIFQLRRVFWDKFRCQFTETDCFAVSYGLALVISWNCSNYQQDALWGANGWYMGLWPQLALVLCYLLISKLWTPQKWMVYMALAVSWVVFLLGWLNRAGIDPLGMGLDYSGFISTIGNINWYCGYLVSIFFVGAGLLWQCRNVKPWLKFLLMIYVYVGFGSILTQGSDSGLLALAAVMLALFVLSTSDSLRMKMFWQEMILLGGACLTTYIVKELFPGTILTDSGMGLVLITGWRPVAVTGMSVIGLTLVNWSIQQERYPEKILGLLGKTMVCLAVTGVSFIAAAIAFNTIYPNSLGFLSGNPLFTFSPEWGNSRGATWRAGWMCFKEQDFLHKMVGIGPDAMPAYEYRDGSLELQELLEDRFGTAVLANAHNEWLTVLVDVGVLGLIAFAGMILTGIRSFLQKDRNRITVACGLCLLAHTVNNVFSFQQSMNTSTLFAVFGIGGAFLRVEKHIDEEESLRQSIHKLAMSVSNITRKR